MKKIITILAITSIMLVGCGKYDDARWENFNNDDEYHTHVKYAYGIERGTFFGFSDGTLENYQIVKGIEEYYE